MIDGLKRISISVWIMVTPWIVKLIWIITVCSGNQYGWTQYSSWQSRYCDCNLMQWILDSWNVNWCDYCKIACMWELKHHHLDNYWKKCAIILCKFTWLDNIGNLRNSAQPHLIMQCIPSCLCVWSLSCTSNLHNWCQT